MAAGNLSHTSDKTNANCALTLAKKDASALAPLRLASGVEVAESEEAIWVRARQPDTTNQNRLQKLPATERFEWLEGDRLRRFDSLISCDRLPALRWQAVAEWLKVAFPAAALPAQRPGEKDRFDSEAPDDAGQALRLVRSNVEVPAGALLTNLESWIRFGAEAPEIRLHGLQFAVNDSDEALILGDRLPPLPGTRYYVRHGIAAPAGLSWEPAVEPEVLRRRLGVPTNCLVLFYQDGSFTRIQAEQWVAASRSAIRATAKAGEERS